MSYDSELDHLPEQNSCGQSAEFAEIRLAGLEGMRRGLPAATCICGFKQVIIEELLVDGLQLTVEKIHLTTNNVKELLRKIAEKKSDESGEVQQPTNQTMMDALPQGMPTLSTVAGGVSNAADGMVQLGKATATRVAAIGQPAKRQEPKDSMVCLKKVEVRSIVVHSVNAMMSDNKTASLSLKAPPIRFLNFSESHGVLNAADMIQLLLREILGSASRAAALDRVFAVLRTLLYRWCLLLCRLADVGCDSVFCPATVAVAAITDAAPATALGPLQ